MGISGVNLIFTLYFPINTPYSIDMANETAGSGQHSHEVPTEEGCVVTIGDGYSKTDVYKNDDGYMFIDRFDISATLMDHCVLVYVDEFGNDVCTLYVSGIDCESPRGLALVGLDGYEEPPEGCEVIWDSREG